LEDNNFRILRALRGDMGICLLNQQFGISTKVAQAAIALKYRSTEFAEGRVMIEKRFTPRSQVQSPMCECF
jgi:hypothetical protein